MIKRMSAALLSLSTFLASFGAVAATWSGGGARIAKPIAATSIISSSLGGGLNGLSPAKLKAAESFDKLARNYWDLLNRLSPISATFNNYPGYNDRLDDISPRGIARSHGAMQKILDRLKAIDRSTLDENRKISHDVLKRQIKIGFDGEKFRFEQWEVDHLYGPQIFIPSTIRVQPMKTEKDAQDLLKRMSRVPKLFNDHIAHLKKGLKAGKASAKRPVEHTIATLEIQAAQPTRETAYAHAADKLPADLKSKYKPLILEAAEKYIRPANQKYLDFLKNKYLPRARPDEKPGLMWVPGGKLAYRHQIRRHTTLDISPTELHQLGLKQLKENHDRMLAVAGKMGHEGDLRSFLDKISKDPGNFYASRQEILEDAKNLVSEIKAMLPQYFGILPKTDMTVEPIERDREKNAVGAEYSPPPDDLSRPGKYYINTHNPTHIVRWDKRALAAHEGVPGHHMQIAIALEQRDLPAFRRNISFTAYVEGWAHYTELLAEEMGVYKSDLDLIGMLSSQAFRAARLVVDTGLHAMGWSRRQAIDFMKAATGMPDDEVANEIDRYMSNGFWPGQALAYKVGQLEILKLRRDAEKKLGDKFDLKKFHDDVLKNGSLPLPILRRVVLGE